MKAKIEEKAGKKKIFLIGENSNTIHFSSEPHADFAVMAETKDEAWKKSWPEIKKIAKQNIELQKKEDKGFPSFSFKKAGAYFLTFQTKDKKEEETHYFTIVEPKMGCVL